MVYAPRTTINPDAAPVITQTIAASRSGEYPASRAASSSSEAGPRGDTECGQPEVGPEQGRDDAIAVAASSRSLTLMTAPASSNVVSGNTGSAVSELV